MENQRENSKNKPEKIYCTKCQAEVEIENETREGDKTTTQLSCGHRIIAIKLVEKISLLEMLELKSKGKSNYSKNHKWKHEQIIGKRVGRDGKIAFIHQVIDRPSGYYKKYVKQGNKVIKDVVERLTQHRFPHH